MYTELRRETCERCRSTVAWNMGLYCPEWHEWLCHECHELQHEGGRNGEHGENKWQAHSGEVVRA